MAVLKCIEIVGISTEGWEAAARAALAEAARTVRHVEALDLLKSSAIVRDGAIVAYHAQVRLTFRVEDESEPLLAVEAAETILHEPAAGNGDVAEAVVERLLDELDDPRAPGPER